MSVNNQHGIPPNILAHLNQIAERLYAGRAAVLVGSGFSRNASDQFPLWNKLGDLLYKQAHGYEPKEDDRSYSNLLRIAEEAEATIGRPALEDFLRKVIPDESVEPSELHTKLLDLPWRDVFTTNYDTLLERATVNVTKRRYTPVLNKLDLASAESPRIVKLHGSFPSQKPFILTEEDYRRYPKDFAPFVNTVRQAFMENTVCLIGFSGDDPNFLQWIGWLRDQLEAKNTQKIYLIGIFNLTDARQKLLAQQNIVVVNMALCHRVDENDHGAALNKIIKFLTEQNAYDLNWPQQKEMIFSNPNKIRPQSKESIGEFKSLLKIWQAERENYPGWLILPSSNRDKLWSYTRNWIEYVVKKDELKDKFINCDELDILLIAELLWRLDKCLVSIIFDSLTPACEVVLEKYYPFSDLFSNSDLPSNSQSTVVCGGEQFKQLDWRLIRKAWLEIQLALFRFYRVYGKTEKWEQANTKINCIFKYLSNEQKQFVYYERYLFAMFTFDIQQAQEAIKNWPLAETLPYWQSKRIMALAEHGFTDDADIKVKSALSATRKKAVLGKNGLSCLYASHEAYQMLLYKNLRDVNKASSINPEQASYEEVELIKQHFSANWSQSSIKENKMIAEQQDEILKKESSFNTWEEDWLDLDYKKENQRKDEWEALLEGVRREKEQLENKVLMERWDELLHKKVDPWREIELLELQLSTIVEPAQSITISSSFDIGLLTQNDKSIDAASELAKACAVLCFTEEVGLPFKVNNWHFQTKQAAENSLIHIQKHFPFWAIATLVRTGKLEAINTLFNRQFIFGFAIEHVDALLLKCLNALIKSTKELSLLSHYGQENFASRLAHILPAVMSRLCCRASYQAKKQVLDFAVKMYQSPHKRRYSHFGRLISRLLKSFSESEQYKLIPELLAIEYPRDMNSLTIRQFNPPLQLLTVDKQVVLIESSLTLDRELIENLLNQVASVHADERGWAFASLEKLSFLGLLDENQTKQFAHNLYLNPDMFGLPDISAYYKFAYLDLPKPEDIDPVKCFKQYVFETAIDVRGDSRSYILTNGNIPIIDEIINAANGDLDFWSLGELNILLGKLIEWWETDKQWLMKKLGNKDSDETSAVFRNNQEFVARFKRLLDVIRLVFAPSLQAAQNSETILKLQSLLNDIREAGLNTLKTDAACCHLYPELIEGIASRIEADLMSLSDSRQRESLLAIPIVLNLQVAAAIHADLIRLLAQFIRWDRTIMLIQALWVVIDLVKNNKQAFNDELQQAVIKRLAVLLDETQYSNEKSFLNVESKIELRCCVIVLASLLRGYYRNMVEPDVINKWHEISTSQNEFAEVKNAWRDIY